MSVSTCDLCRKRERDRMVVLQGLYSSSGYPADACAACRRLLEGGHSGDCFACGGSVDGEHEPRGTVKVADARAEPNELCAGCFSRASPSHSGALFPEPGRREIEASLSAAGSVGQ